VAAAADSNLGRGELLRPDSRSQAASVGSSGVVVLSIEPAALGPAAEATVPVIFPGYVLPDDSREGFTHEGS
jgi:hypothetical protein